MSILKQLHLKILCIICICLAGCASLKTGFHELDKNQEIEVISHFGDGKYYWFWARGSDLKQENIEKRRNSIESLVHSSDQNPLDCLDGYEIITRSYIAYEGGSASIFVRCHQK